MDLVVGAMLYRFLIAALVFNCGCSSDKSSIDFEETILIDDQHDHYHVHGKEVSHDHNHDDSSAGGHTHDHDHDADPADLSADE